MWLNLVAAVVCFTMGSLNIAIFTVKLLEKPRHIDIIARPNGDVYEASEMAPTSKRP